MVLGASQVVDIGLQHALVHKGAHAARQERARWPPSLPQHSTGRTRLPPERRLR